jgi:hypothetical protein
MGDHQHTKVIAVRTSGSTIPDMILEIVRQSGGRSVDADDHQSLTALADWARDEGFLRDVVAGEPGRAYREVERDHRGVRLPLRHLAGGIITPQ